MCSEPKAAKTMQKPLYGMNLAQLEALAARTGLPRFAARQIARWLYVKHIDCIEKMKSEAKRS